MLQFATIGDQYLLSWLWQKLLVTRFYSTSAVIFGIFTSYCNNWLTLFTEIKLPPVTEGIQRHCHCTTNIPPTIPLPKTHSFFSEFCSDYIDTLLLMLLSSSHSVLHVVGILSRGVIVTALWLCCHQSVGIRGYYRQMVQHCGMQPDSQCLCFAILLLI